VYHIILKRTIFRNDIPPPIFRVEIGVCHTWFSTCVSLCLPPESCDFLPFSHNSENGDDLSSRNIGLIRTKATDLLFINWVTECFTGAEYKKIIPQHYQVFRIYLRNVSTFLRIALYFYTILVKPVQLVIGNVRSRSDKIVTSGIVSSGLNLKTVGAPFTYIVYIEEKHESTKWINDP
jgi:hypothetical protein